MLKHHKDSRGTLSYTEFKNLIFQPKRMYFIHDVPKGQTRGGHGHRIDQQYLICIKGEIKVNLVNHLGRKEVTLGVGESVFIDKMVWSTQQYLTGDDIVLVLCSTEYNPEDYIDNLEDILAPQVKE